MPRLNHHVNTIPHRIRGNFVAHSGRKKCSRALATRQFRKETGRSILGEIHEIRIQKMCELLSHSTLPIAMVVERSGYESDGYAKRFFLRRTGMTMRQYRRQTTSL